MFGAMTACAQKTTQTGGAQDPLAWFAQMIPHCKEYARAAHTAGRPIAGIMCEYAPRELIMAAGGVPVCLCGGDPDTIPAAETQLPANLCPLVKSTYGYLVEKANPFLEMADLVIAETTCDGKKKMFELMGESRPTYLMAVPQRENDPAAIEQMTQEMHRLKKFLEDRYKTTITTEKLRAAIATMNRERRLRRQLAELMKRDKPPLTGRQLLDLKSIISGIPADLDRYELALQVYGNRADAPSSNGEVRVLLTGVPLVHGAERVMDIIEAHGCVVVCQENCTGLKPILDDVDETAPDPLRALAEKYYPLPCSIKTPNTRRLELIRRLVTEYRAEAVIELIWHACLTYAVESYQVKRLVEEALGLPYLRIETDYSPADSARIAARVEALAETARARARSGVARSGPTSRPET